MKKIFAYVAIMIFMLFVASCDFTSDPVQSEYEAIYATFDNSITIFEDDDIKDIRYGLTVYGVLDTGIKEEIFDYSLSGEIKPGDCIFIVKYYDLTTSFLINIQKNIEDLCEKEGHEYDFENIVWEWTNDNKVYMILECLRNQEHKHTLEANVKQTTLKYAECTLDGMLRLDAYISYNGNDYSTFKEVLIPATGHSYSEEWNNNGKYHWKASLCDCGVIKNQGQHSFYNNECIECNYKMQASEGIVYSLSDDGNSYVVSGFSDDCGKNIIIPSEYDGKQVIAIGDNAFYENNIIESIVLPQSIISLGVNSFYGCKNLKKVLIYSCFISYDESAFINCNEQLSLNEVGHDWVIMSIEKQSTCSVNGLAHYKCSICNDSKDDILELDDHVFGVETNVDATCIEAGYTLHQCVNCNYEYRDNFVYTGGHAYTEWEDEVKPTCCSDGHQIRKCIHCGNEEIRNSVKLAHNYVLESAIEKVSFTENTYVCSYCGDRIINTEEIEKIYTDFIVDCDSGFSFFVIFDGEISQLKSNLNIYDAYFENTDYLNQNHEEIIVDFSAELIDDINNVYQIKPIVNYEEGYTYIAELLSDDIEFKDYNCSKLNFSISSQSENDNIEFNDEIIYVNALIDENPGYSYKLTFEDESDIFYATFWEVGGFEIEDILCFGEISCAADLFSFNGQEVYFGKIVDIYPDKNGLYIVELITPELVDIFTKLDVSTTKEINFEDAEFEKNFEEEITKSLLNNSEFVDFLGAVNQTTTNYLKERKLKSDYLSIPKFMEKLTFNPSFVISGSKVSILIDCGLNVPIKSNDKEIGSIDVSFSISAEVGFEFSAEIELRYWWIFPTGIEYFDFNITQSSSFGIEFSVNIDLDYTLTETTQKYTLNKNSNCVHCSDCRRIENSKNLKELSEIDMMKGVMDGNYHACEVCKPIEKLNREVFLINNNSDTASQYGKEAIIHCVNCMHSTWDSDTEISYDKSILEDTQKYHLCKDCDPANKDEQDFEDRLLEQLKYRDYQQIVEEIRAWAQGAEIDEYESEGLTICRWGFSFAFVFTANIEINLILDFDIEASLTYKYKIEKKNVYGIQLRNGELKTYSTETEHIAENSLVMYGKIDFKFGIQANAYISFLGLSNLIRAGVTAEVGIHNEMAGIVNITQDENYAAAYYQLSIYCDVEAYYKFFSLNETQEIFSREYVILALGYSKAYYKFEEEIESIQISEDISIENFVDLSVEYYDLHSLTTKNDTLKWEGVDGLYSIELSLKNGEYLSVIDGKLVVSKNAPCIFSDKLIIKVIGKCDWVNYTKDSAAYFFNDYVIEINYINNDGHNFMVSKIIPATCEEDGIEVKTCDICGSVVNKTLEKTGHNYDTGNIIWDWSDDYSACTATFTCLNDSKHSVSLVADVEIEEIAPSCTTEGLKSFIAKIVFNDNEYLEFVSEKVNKISHVLGEGFSFDDKYHWNNCDNCGGKINMLQHVYNQEILSEKYLLSPATCESRAKYYYSCECGVQGEEHFEYGEILEHKYDLNNINWTWSDDCSSCYATLKCLNDDSHSYNIVATIELVEVMNPTCSSKGKMTYKATFEYLDVLYSDVLTIEIEKENHSYSEWNEEKNSTCVVEGNIGYYQCLVCKKYFDSDYDELSTIIIPKINHNIGENGCSECGLYFDMELSEDETYYILSGRGIMNDDSLTIPAYYKNLPVKEIAQNAFKDGVDIVTVNFALDSQLQIINDSAFYSCISLISIHLPKSVKTIGEGAFALCEGLNDVYFDGSKVEWNSIQIGDKNDCLLNANILFAEIITDESLFIFELNEGETSYSVVGNNFTDEYVGTIVSIPESYQGLPVNNIKKEALSYSKINGVIIPKTIIEIDHYAFNNCPTLEIIVVDENNPVFDSRDNCNAIIETKNNALIVGCSKTIIPNSVKSIETGAFFSCENLNEIEFPNGIEKIGYSFSGCSSLKEVYIPSSVSIIDKLAFSNCSALVKIIVDENNSIYDSRDNCNAIIETASNKFILGCNKSVIPETVTIIGTSAFSNCRNIENIIIPASVKTIEYGAFAGCESLKSIIIPPDITSLEFHLFYGCSSLESITIPASVTKISDGAFLFCESLNNVFYEGTLDEWSNIEFENENSNPLNFVENFYFLDENGDFIYNDKMYSKFPIVSICIGE